MTADSEDYCSEPGCVITGKHWHCVDCGEPCNVGEDECDGCYAYAEEMLDR